MGKQDRAFICSNEKCKKMFDAPIVVQNLGLQNKYSGCPSCLIEILKKAFTKGGRKRTKEVLQIQEDRAKMQGIDPRFFQYYAQPSACSYHFSYLSERSKGEAVPDECLLCTKLMDCMRQQQPE